ncbi:baseplate J/gp47 family protein [Aquimarina megaterium]|uniref:baseplate J/gp47 family protein n=1 Tax=Aquimarina megaterium TaxID=1443666 RepID=UPI00046F4869|nr:baseplate J/gp47 family protein [Aquimarina megaterium]
MSDCPENRNPLIRNGTSQGQRVLSKLSPSSVEIIDKSTEDWMVWAGKFSDNIRYTALNNAAVGTMKPFFTSNISAQLALAASYPPEMLSQYIREILLYIETEDTGLKKAYTYLFDIIFSYFVIVDKLFQLTQEDKEYNSILLNHIQAKLLPLEHRAFAYYKASLAGTPAQKLIVNSTSIDLNIFHEPITGHEEAINSGLSGLAGKRYLDSSDFSTYYSAISSDPSIFGGLSGFAKKIKYVSQHNFFTSILDEISASATFISKLSQKYLNTYLSDWPNHQPNYALYLAWLELLDATKGHLNELTGRHLDFYYKNVLQLKPLSQSPDKAFLTLELNKITSSYAIKGDTLFIGPKDDTGNTITYSSNKETVLNKAKIKHLSALYFGEAEDNIGSQINNKRLFAAPIINSADGLGEKLEEDVIAWHPFHIKKYENAELAAITMPKAEIGFAIASHFLRLKEGLRTITMEVFLGKNVSTTNFNYKAYITTEKEWLEIDFPDLKKDTLDGKVGFTFTCTIPADKDPIVAYNKDTHLGSLTATEPVLKIVLEHQDDQPFIYDELASTAVSKIKLTVNVGQIEGSYNEDGIKNLELHNDSNPLNPSKPFHPWGPEPTIGNSFIIGSDEIFYKKGAKIKFNFDWKDYPLNDDGSINLSAIDHDPKSSIKYISFRSTNRKSTGDDGYVPKVEILKLSKNKWVSLYDDKQVFRVSNDAESEIVSKTSLNINLSSNTHKDLFLNKDQSWRSYSANSNKGFLKIKLNNDFGHRDYYLALQSFFKLNDDNATAPAYPYNPTLQSFSVSYEASCTSQLSNKDKFDDRPLEFFHIGPFGDSEQHKILQNRPIKLVSKLIRRTDGIYKSQGSLLIGIENIQPGDTQAILFQVQEGSEDPLLEKPEEHLIWEYLMANNVWKKFDDDSIGDNTSGLIESGLINFIIPKNASLEHTAFENGLIWIRCSVKEAPDAVCKIVGIYPNAIEVQRIIPEKTAYESMISSPGEIKKLFTPEAKIKKIEQPFTSFDGTPIENDEAFYLRASERLRHKNRAITIWDYERLVLQAFPEIYKVKCLNHTKIGGSLSEGNLVYNEVAPGNVSIITIPNLANRNDIDPLKPYTKKSTLKKIEEFLNERTSCQVSIHTAQPDFEEVKVKCTITLRNEFPDINYYKEVIQKDITNFLSPWAFASDTDLNFGGRIHQSVLIDFIEELPYVDFLTDFELFHIKSSGEITKVDEAVASTARSILVSVPAIKHDLHVILKTINTTEAIDCNDE